MVSHAWVDIVPEQLYVTVESRGVSRKHCRVLCSCHAAGQHADQKQDGYGVKFLHSGKIQGAKICDSPEEKNDLSDKFSYFHARFPFCVI